MCYPSTVSYDNTYTADRRNAYPGATTSYSTDPHVANGLITTVNGQPRYVFWTSGRVIVFLSSSGSIFFN